MNTTINLNTRESARRTVRNLKATGKVCRIIDNGIGSENRWMVDVQLSTPAPTKAHKRVVKVRSTRVNEGFDIRKVNTGVKGFDVFYDGEFLIRRETKIDAYEAALKMAHRSKLNVSGLRYK
ncbi:hypothetical protein KUA24_3 [Vibrio phage HNL01]|nr:hypothetical protein KUA24_3 [Vibrio phage HNL01]